MAKRARVVGRHLPREVERRPSVEILRYYGRLPQQATGGTGHAHGHEIRWSRGSTARWAEAVLRNDTNRPNADARVGTTPILMNCGTHDISAADARRSAEWARRECVPLIDEQAPPGHMHVDAVLALPQGRAAQARVAGFLRKAAA